MEKILIDQNRHWTGNRYDNLMERACLNELYRLLSLKEIMVLLGVRRCGKTTIFRLLINYLMQHNDPTSIFYVNLDDPYFDAASVDAKYLYKIVENAERFSGTKIAYLFLDEIQNIPGWEKFIKSVYDSEKFKKIFITGSNSSLLQGQYATLLSGRYVNMMIHPLIMALSLQSNSTFLKT